MRKIHLTESQARYIHEHLMNEMEGNQATVAAETDATGKITTQSINNTIKNMKTNNMKGSISIDPEKTDGSLGESYSVYTKRQLKEARLRKLTSESKMYTKKNFGRK